jgi:hypothetical protein
MTLYVTLLLGLLIGGCAGGQTFDRDTMRAVFGHNGTPAAKHQSAAAEPEKSALPTPFRVALYFVERDFPLQHNIQKAEWTSMDKDTLAAGLAPLKQEGIVTDIVLLADSTIRGHDTQKIRNTAARYGADAVLIVKGVGAVDRSNNAYAALYVTGIGAYLAPGTVAEALFLIEGDLWDTRVEQLYATQTAEGHAQVAAAAMKLEDRAVLALAKKSALETLGKKVGDELIRVKGERPPSRDRLR